MNESRSETSAGMSILALTTVSDISMRPHARAEVDTPLYKVVEEMKSRGRGAVLIEESGALVGIFTERDLLNRVDHADPLWSHVIVRDVMTPHPMVIRSGDTLAEAMRRLTQGRRRHLPIVDDKGTTLGLISIRDILTFVASKFPEEMMNLPPDPSHES